jgi:hypothetical protein
MAGGRVRERAEGVEVDSALLALTKQVATLAR